MKKSLIKYASAVGIAGAMALIVLWLRDFASVDSKAEQLRHLADAFTIPGVIFMMVAALIWVASDGFFDGFGYAGRYAARMLLPFLKLDDEKFYDYKMRKAERRLHGYSFIFFTGLAFFLIALAFIAAFYAAAPS